MEKLGLYEFKLIEKDLKQLVGAKFNQTTIINSRSFLCTFSMIKDQKLFITLEHQRPFLSLINLQDSVCTVTGSANDTYRKYIRDSYIVDVTLLGNDKIIIFKLQKPNELFEKEQYYAVFEFVPQRPNMLILDENKKIIFALHYSSALSQRSIVLGMTYEAPISINLVENKTDISIENIRNLAKKTYFEAIQKRKEEKYEPLFKFIKIRLKSLEKKLKVLANSIDEAKQRLVYQDHGNMILAYSQDESEIQKYVSENSVRYDDTISPGINANNCFKIYKKAKRTIEMDNIEIVKCQNEISYLSSILTSSQYMDEDEMIALAEEIMPHKINKDIKHPKAVGIGFIVNNGTKILFGKNAKSNDKLTFSVAEKNDTFMHIKDYHGAHILIKSKDPTNEDLLLGSEIALLLSNKEQGEIYYTTINNVKKGDKLGLVNLLNYKTILLNSIRQETKDLLNKYKNI